MPSINLEDVIRRYQAGESANAIGESLGVFGHQVTDMLRGAGVPTRSHREALGLKARDLPTEEITRRYTAGESVATIAKHFGVSHPTIKSRLTQAGVPLRNRGEATKLARSVTVDLAEIVRRYEGGESELSLSRFFSLSRAAIRQRLLSVGVRCRNGSDANSLRMARLSQEERLALADSAHAAVRGRRQSEEHRCKIALEIERRGVVTSPNERALAGWLRGLGVEIKPLKAVGRYNVDVALTESRIAVEIFGGHWHATGHHARRFRPRIKYLMDRGWLPVIVWVTTSYPLRHCVAEKIVTIHEGRRRDEAAWREEQVIRGDGYVASVGQVNRDNGAIVMGHNPGNPKRGADGRFR